LSFQICKISMEYYKKVVSYHKCGNFKGTMQEKAC
jgi:hypothetical protein